MEVTNTCKILGRKLEDRSWRKCEGNTEIELRERGRAWT